jgi:hypothetical protein
MNIEPIARAPKLPIPNCSKIHSYYYFWMGNDSEIWASEYVLSSEHREFGHLATF